MHQIPESKRKTFLSLSFARFDIFLFIYMPQISSIRRSSSSLNLTLDSMPTLSMICAGFDAPISTLVMSPSRKIHASAICARLCPRSLAISLSALTLSIVALPSASSFRNLPSVRIRLSCGIRSI